MRRIVHAALPGTAAGAAAGRQNAEYGGGRGGGQYLRDVACMAGASIVGTPSRALHARATSEHVTHGWLNLAAHRCPPPGDRFVPPGLPRAPGAPRTAAPPQPQVRVRHGRCVTPPPCLCHVCHVGRVLRGTAPALHRRTDRDCEAPHVIHTLMPKPPGCFCYPPPPAHLAGGEGATVREILRHKTVERVVMVDIDKVGGRRRRCGTAHQA